MTGFNSILVRLKVLPEFATTEDKFTFQFHTGSIKSPGGRVIESSQAGFNSILVRLKDTEVESGEPFTHKFQFHTGSIKSQSG